MYESHCILGVNKAPRCFLFSGFRKFMASFWNFVVKNIRPPQYLGASELGSCIAVEFGIYIKHKNQQWQLGAIALLDQATRSTGGPRNMITAHYHCTPAAGLEHILYMEQVFPSPPSSLRWFVWQSPSRDSQTCGVFTGWQFTRKRLFFPCKMNMFHFEPIR